MHQFDVHQSSGPLLVILQSDMIGELNVVVAAPLVPAEDWPVPARHLHPVCLLDDSPYVLVTNHLAAVTKDRIGRRVGSVDAHRSDIINALDFLFTGI
ncbi:conserved hypothetical protein [Magnetospirillum sp. LM-5]|uniref:CcdB family protein n=1 Tax=Magnetospirillum sp. LM-5 TaxID=2681466 RepID=UPI00137DB9B2|nr:CcdB family protein [Magnetospirillum sp. LM-5]CAA7622907.1 conserved hypothetical protein [Magnetospirillum sp. LM-5]